MKNHFLFEKNQFYVIHLESWLQPGEYVINMAFKAVLREELEGFYRMNYTRKDGAIRFEHF